MPDDAILLPCETHPAICIEADGRCRADAERPPLLVCGSFNPLHEGHWQMAERAGQFLGLPFAFELSLVNVEKPSLEENEVRRRAAAFRQRACLWLTRVPTYDAKAALFPGTVFVVGADTAERIVTPRFYARSMGSALASVHSQGCRFLVAGRVDAGGQFRRLEDLPIPEEHAHLFLELPDFRLDISSTMLRERAGAH